MYFFTSFLCFILIYTKFVNSFATHCYKYDENACQSNPNQCTETIEQCTILERGTKYQCFVLWNKTASVVKHKGCFIKSGEDCSGQSDCIEKGEPKSNGLLFCCCESNLCNKEFSWKPTPTPPVVVRDAPEISDDTVPYTVYATLILSVTLLLLGMYLLKKKKISYFNQIPSLDQRPQSPPSPVPEKLRSIELIEIKAQGKFGEVWKASDKTETVAVKKMLMQEKQSWLTEQEVYKLPLMNHDNILRFIAAEKHETYRGLELWLITAYHELGSLHDFLKTKTVSWEQLSHIAYTMARGLTHLHEEIPSEKIECHKLAVAHRDFKSSNVLLKNDLTACIADFGLALIFRPSRSCGDTHGQVGTLRYMAPEILEGSINFSRDSFLRIDMYACGLVLWELVSRCSFQGGPVPDYKLPFEEEVKIVREEAEKAEIQKTGKHLPVEDRGKRPVLEEIQHIVVHKKMRPVIKKSWRQHPGLAVLCSTMEELWDHDAEARLSACCVMERTSFHLAPTLSPSTPLMYDVSETNNNVPI